MIKRMATKRVISFTLHPIATGIWFVKSDLGTMAAIGSVREIPSNGTYSFVPQPSPSPGERELAKAGYRGRRLDGFGTAQEAAEAGAAL